LNKNILKVCLAVILFAAALFFYFEFSPASAGRGEQAYFYDLKQQKLFLAPRSSIPPLPGLNQAENAGVRAIVISTTGDARDLKHRKIAYLEKYSPELKQLFEAVHRARAAGQSAEGMIQRSQIPAGTFVRRPQDTQWYSLTSAEGERIVNEWNTPGPDGVVPVVCSP
jgi:hypothetical protein